MDAGLIEEVANVVRAEHMSEHELVVFREASFLAGNGSHPADRERYRTAGAPLCVTWRLSACKLDTKQSGLLISESGSPRDLGLEGQPRRIQMQCPSS
jgi:hypothetical protein